MLYSIIPPILIVLSLIGIITIILKKSSRVAGIIAEETRREELAENNLEKVGFFGKFTRNLKKIPWSRAKFFLLDILEKIMKFFRSTLFKLGGIFGNWSANIREKRRNRQMEKQATQNQSSLKEEDILEKLKDYKLEQRRETISFDEDVLTETTESIEIKFDKELADEQANKDKGSQMTETVNIVVNEEKKIKPMISDKVVSPRPRTEIKDRLEELLIERIAANPKDIEAYERLGEYYMEIKSYGDAKECLKQVIKLDPMNRNVKYKMRRLEHLLSK